MIIGITAQELETARKIGILGAYTPENWYICPHCHKKLLKQSETAQSQGLYIKCKGCGREVEIRIGDNDGKVFPHTRKNR